MFWLGLILPVVYVPAWTGATILTGWVVLSCALPFFLLRKIEMTPAHWLGLAFLAYASASVLWAPIYQQAVWDLWLIWLCAFCFCLGASHPNLRSLWVGMALGLGVSDVVAVFQRIGYHPVFASDSWYQAGLFVNPDMFGETAALLTLALLASRVYWPLCLTLPPIYLTQSRTVWAAYAVVIAVWLWDRWRWYAVIPALVVTLAAGTFVTSRSPASIQERLAIWQDTTDGLTFAGRGAGSFFMLYPEFARRTDTMYTRPEDPHNEFLNLAFEYGLGALPLLTLLALGCFTPNPYRATLVAFMVMAFFSFPTRIPCEAFVGMVALGRICAGWPLAWPVWLHRRLHGNAWPTTIRSAAVSLEPIHPREARLRWGDAR